MNAARHVIPPTQARPTINEVARRAQVSVATVSRVINTPESVRPETRDRVLACMSALAYVPHGAARDREGARTGNIGVLLQASPGITRADTFFLEILSGIESAADDAGLAVVVSVRHSIADLAENGPRSLAPGRIDGLIVTGTQVTGRQLEGIRQSGLTVVLLGPEEEALGLWCVTSDARRGSELAVTHLLEVGRRWIAHIGGPLDSAGSLKKREGVRLAHERAKVKLDPRLHDFGDEIHSRDRGWRAVERLLAGGVPFDGVYADDDLLAAGAIGALTAHGRRVPDDVSVVGFGGLAEVRSSRPPITTVDVDFFQQGWLAATILNKIVRTRDQAPPAARILLETRLTVRGSSVPSVRGEQAGGAGLSGVL